MSLFTLSNPYPLTSHGVTSLKYNPVIGQIYQNPHAPSLPLPSIDPFHPIKYFVNKLNLFTILLWIPRQLASNWSIAGTCLLHTIKLGLLHWRDFFNNSHSYLFDIPPNFIYSSIQFFNPISKICCLKMILSYLVSLSIIEIASITRWLTQIYFFLSLFNLNFKIIRNNTKIKIH